jgi:hypothetical protein
VIICRVEGLREELMIFMVKYLTKRDADIPGSDFKRSFFAEHPTEPTPEMVRKLVDGESGGDFVEGSIEIEPLPERDAEEIKKQPEKVRKFT